MPGVLLDLVLGVPPSAQPLPPRRTIDGPIQPLPCYVPMSMYPSEMRNYNEWPTNIPIIQDLVGTYVDLRVTARFWVPQWAGVVIDRYWLSEIHHRAMPRISVYSGHILRLASTAIGDRRHEDLEAVFALGGPKALLCLLGIPVGT